MNDNSIDCKDALDYFIKKEKKITRAIYEPLPQNIFNDLDNSL